MTGSTLRTALAFSLGIALLALPAGRSASAAPSAAEPGCAGETAPDRLEGLSPEGDLLLGSGRPAKLAGIRLPETQPYRDMALAWLRGQTGRSLLVQGREGRDRWDRASVRIRIAEDSAVLDLGHALVEAGLAIVDADLGPFCQPELLAFEATARERRLGLWADARYNPLNVEHADSLQDRIGRFVLVEGRIRSIGERKQRTYLNFGGHWAEDFKIIIPQRTWRLMVDRGWSAEALKGQRIRARGILQSWQGPALTIVIPEMIERLDGKSLAR